MCLYKSISCHLRLQKFSTAFRQVKPYQTGRVAPVPPGIATSSNMAGKSTKYDV